MGVLVHPNYSDELANGVAVSFDPIDARDDVYYVNTQLGEDLVTNPEAHSVPEEILLYHGNYYNVLGTSNQVPPGQLLLTTYQLTQLRRHLEVIHEDFKELYNPGSGEPFAMEIEFKITSENILAIKQARPWVFSVPSARPAANSPATGAPTISGTAQVGETLTADTSGIADADGRTNATFSYQWLVDDSDISGAANATYTLASADEGKAIKVEVSFTDDSGNKETLTSAATGAVAAAPTSNSAATGAPTISGTAQVGETLTADTSGIADADGLANATYSYQWLLDDSDIAGATSLTYTLVDADEGKAIKVEVSFTDDAGNGETLTRGATDAVAAEPTPNSTATGAPTITGTAQVGEMLTANTSGIADADGLTNAAFTYQWLADDIDIAGATNTTYTLMAADEGKAIKVEVSFTDDAGNEETLTSAGTEAVDARPNSLATGAPTVNGTAQVGETLEADTSGIADADGLSDVQYEYQWLAADAEIAGATSSTYTVAAADEGKAIKVEVTFTDDAGNDESLTSTATDAVAVAEPSEPPAKPTGLSATASHDSVTLTWDDPGDDTITGYVILRRVRENNVGGEFSELVADTSSAATTYTDDTVVAGTTYTYRVKAINGYGVSERSRWFHIDTPAAPEAVEGDEQGGEDGGGAPGHATPPGPGGRANVSEGDGEDLPADTTTTGEVEVGGSVTGNITSASDRDWFRVDLKKDKRYQIDLEGADTNRGTLTDPLLNAMRDASNNSVAGTWNDDGGVGINARTIFTAPADGAHYVVAAGNGATGTYTLSVILLGANGASEADTDFPATTATTGRVDVGASATGNRGSIGDADWFRVDLEVGKTYQIDLTGEYGGGGTLKDPYLDNIRDSSGTQISNTFNGDVDFANDNLDSQIIFTPTAAGTYYLVAFANGSITGTYTLSVRDITPAANNAPVFDPATATREVAENSAAGTDVGDPIPEATDADTGDMLTYSMEGTDAASFSFDASTRQITTISGVDYNHEATQNSYSVTVKVSDGTDSATIAVTIDVTDVNEKSAKPDKPTLAAVTGSSTSLTATWTKPDLNGGPAIADYDVAYRERPSGNWEDSGITGAVLTTTITGLKADTSYQVRVRASNNEAISDWSDLSDVVKTNAEAVTPTLSVADAAATEGDEVTFTVTLSPAATEDVTATWTASIGSDDTAVAADLGSTRTGTLTFTAGDTEERFTVATAEDELHEDNETFTVTLSSPSSNATLATDPPATGTITDDDAPPTLSVDDATASEGRDVAFTVRLSPASGRRVTATWTASIESGDTAVAAATASDRVTESAETFTLTLSRPENAELADATGQGTINAAVLPNTAPVITTTSPVAVAENGTAVATLAATDADGDPIAWSKTGGADADRFALSAQGVLTFKAEPDYESPADVASADPANDADNNEYVVFVTASDGTDDTELQLVVRVTNANDAPTGTVTIDDTSPTIGDVLTASAAAVADQDGLPDPFAPAWQWYRTPMGGSETEIDRATAATYTVVRADYGATLTAKATWTDKGGFTNTLASAATEATTRPFCTQNPGDVWCGVVTVEWYEPLNAYGYVLAFGSDPQAGDLSDKDFRFRGMTYTIDLILVEPKAASFFGAVLFSLDRALPRNAREALLLYIGPASRNSSPSGDTSLSFHVWPSLSGGHTYFWPSDKESEAIGDDPGLVDPGPGVDWSNQTTVTVRLRENAAPAFMAAGPFTVNENETAVGTVTATDADPGDTYLRYAITGGADGGPIASDGTVLGQFEIDAESGALSFKSAPNFEDPQDDGADNVYEVEVEARSGIDLGASAEDTITNRTRQTITVTVLNVPEQPAKPAKPTLAAVADSTTSLRVNWTKPDLNGGPEITGYDLQYREGTTGNWQDFAHTGTAVTTTITGLTADTSYQVQVRAKNGETDSDWSDPSDAVSTNAATPGTTPTLSIADAAASEGSNVTFTVTLSEADAADVTATWTASVETGDTAVAADLGATKTGTVTVSAGDTTGTFTVPTVEDTTVEVNETFTVTLSGVSSNAQLAADPTATGTINDDDTAPTISTVAVTSTPVLETDTYGAGETIEVSVTFDEAVTATSDTDFVLSVGGATRAPLLRGSGTATLVFGYTVAPGDEDDNGIWIGDQDRTLVGDRNGNPQSGTITSVATNTAADLTHVELGTQSDHKVDGSRSIVSVAVTSTPVLETDTYGAGETIRFTVTFTAEVDVTGDPVLQFALGNSGNVREVDAAYESGSGSKALVFGYTVVSTDEDDNGIFLRDEEDFDNPDGPVRLDSNDEIEFTGTSTDVPLYWEGRGTQSGHKVDGSRTTGNNPPSFTSLATFDAAENQTAAGTVAAADSDADDSVTGYAITGGADQALFEIGATTGELTFKTAPNYEDPQDSGTDQRLRGDGPGDQRRGARG